MLDRSTWEFINTFAPWFAAFGTFLAVVTSLYLAGRDRVIHLAVNAGIRTIVLPGQTIASGQDVVSISVTNVGYRAAAITGIFWKAGVIQSHIFHQVPPSSPQLPCKLSDGDEVAFLFTMQQFKDGVAPIIESLAGRWSATFHARSIRAGVYTSIGKRFTTIIEKRLQQWFVDQMLDHRKKHRTS